VPLDSAPHTLAKAVERGRKGDWRAGGAGAKAGTVAALKSGELDGRDSVARCQGADARLERGGEEENGAGDAGAQGGPGRETADGAAVHRKARSYMAVDELPPEERAEIDRLLAGGLSGYQQISDALQAKGFFIVKGAVGRYEAGRRAEERLMRARLDEVKRWADENAGFDLAGAALAMAVAGFYERLKGDREMFNDLPADKAASGLIAAVRAIAQYEKASGSRKKSLAAARAEVVAEIRAALAGEPELRAGIEKLLECEGGGRAGTKADAERWRGSRKDAREIEKLLEHEV